MKLQLRVRPNNKKWETVDVKELINKSVVDYIADEYDKAMAALMDDEDEVVMVVANTTDLKEHYEKKKIPFFLAHEMQELLGSRVAPQMVLHTFEGSTLFEIKALEPEPETEIVP